MKNTADQANQSLPDIKARENELEARIKAFASKEKALQKNERLFHSLVEAAAGKIGQDFFNNIVIRLSEWLNAECVLIGKIVENERVKAVPLYLDGKITHDFSYDLAGSPCDITTRKGYCEFPENVIELFPKDKILVDVKAEGYIGYALYNGSGDINGVICAISRKKLKIPPYARDIMKIIGSRVTAEIERMKTEEALKQSESDLRESNIIKDKLISIIAHDLRSPFNAMLGFTDLLIKNYENFDHNKRKEIIGLLFRNVKDAHNLVEDLITWVLTQRGVIHFKPDPIDLEELISETVLLMENAALEKTISIQYEGCKDIIVKADRQMLSTVIRNLLANAIKYTHTGGNIKVSARIMKEQSRKLTEICVSDNGIGMDAQKVSGLFQTHLHSSENGTADEKGTGLGLILCKELVERNGGTITAQSEIGKGSRFFVMLNAI